MVGGLRRERRQRNLTVAGGATPGLGEAGLGMTDRYDLVDLDVQRSSGITATYADGYVASFALVDLRLGCPCATCRALGDRDETPWPRPDSPLPLSIADASLHGAWGINIVWNDGHSTGIYTFEYLRRWAEHEPV